MADPLAGRRTSKLRRFHIELVKARRHGVHSHAMRRAGIAGNPSQMAKTLAREHKLSKVKESVDGDPGVRFFLTMYAPPGSDPVEPDSDPRVGGSTTQEPHTTPPCVPAAVDPGAASSTGGDSNTERRQSLGGTQQLGPADTPGPAPAGGPKVPASSTSGGQLPLAADPEPDARPRDRTYEDLVA